MSQNLARGRQRLAGTFASDVRILEMLEKIGVWPQGTGLYCVMRAGDLTVNHSRFQIAPVTNASEEICALWTNILGLSFVLVLETSVLADMPQLASSVYRPQSVSIRHPSGSREILLTWNDGNPHRGDLTLDFVRDVDAAARRQPVELAFARQLPPLLPLPPPLPLKAPLPGLFAAWRLNAEISRRDLKRAIIPDQLNGWIAYHCRASPPPPRAWAHSPPFKRRSSILDRCARRDSRVAGNPAQDHSRIPS